VSSVVRVEDQRPLDDLVGHWIPPDYFIL
jgi:hypothetical protein